MNRPDPPSTEGRRWLAVLKWAPIGLSAVAAVAFDRGGTGTSRMIGAVFGLAGTSVVLCWLIRFWDKRVHPPLRPDRRLERRFVRNAKHGLAMGGASIGIGFVLVFIVPSPFLPLPAAVLFSCRYLRVEDAHVRIANGLKLRGGSEALATWGPLARTIRALKQFEKAAMTIFISRIPGRHSATGHSPFVYLVLTVLIWTIPGSVIAGAWRLP